MLYEVGENESENSDDGHDDVRGGAPTKDLFRTKQHTDTSLFVEVYGVSTKLHSHFSTFFQLRNNKMVTNVEQKEQETKKIDRSKRSFYNTNYKSNIHSPSLFPYGAMLYGKRA